MKGSSDGVQVLLLTDADVFAGTEQHILALACGLRDLGVHVRVGCPFPAVLADRATERGVGTLTVQKRGLVDIAAVNILRSELASGRTDLIHAHNGRTALSSALAVALARRGKLVATQHFLEPAHTDRTGTEAMLSRFAHRWMNARVAHFIAVSDEAKRRMIQREGVSKDKMTVIPNGISPDLSCLRPAAEVKAGLGAPDGSPLVVCVSRLETEKDVATLVRAMGAVRDRIPSVRCVIAGAGSQRTVLERLAGHSGLQDCVTFVGYVSDALSLIRAGDLLVLPSLAEPFGLVLLEAMALGKPVVATDAGGPREIVQDGHTGLLVPPGDPAALADAIVRILSDSVLAAEMGSKGCERYEVCYTAERMAQETLAVYRKILGEG